MNQNPEKPRADYKLLGSSIVRLEPKRGGLFISKDFWTHGGGDTVEAAIERAGRELEEDPGADVMFVVRVEAVVRRKKGFDVE